MSSAVFGRSEECCAPAASSSVTTCRTATAPSKPSRARFPRHHHLYRFDHAAIARLCREADLELVEVERYGLLPRNSLGRLPRPLAESMRPASAWHLLDAGLSRLLSPFCQNYCFVARRPSGSAALES